MAATSFSGDAAAMKPSASPPKLTTIARELRQQILIEVFKEPIHNDTIEYISFYTVQDEHDRDSLSIIKQAQDLLVALPEVADDIAFVKQKARDSFNEKVRLLSKAVSEVIRADENRDIAGYIGCDTIQIYMRLGGQLNLGSTGEENRSVMEVWWRENFDKAINKSQRELAVWVHKNRLGDGCLSTTVASMRDTHKRFKALEALESGQLPAFYEEVRKHLGGL
ncbi:MAP kinase kinase kinase [Venturia nashicola]|nr:MAP kinase kinase kinase [Venturia nashicola]